MKAIILAAGKGTRLLPLTLETPKTLVKINGKPIIEYVIESLPQEIDEVIVIVSHLKNKIQDFLGQNFLNKKITCVEQGELTGTFGAVLSVKPFLTNNEKFLVLNGDDIHEKDGLIKCLKYPRSMTVEKRVMPNYYSTQKNENDYLSGFKSQTEDEKTEGAFIATGAYVLDTNLFNHPGVLLSTGEYGLPQTVLSQMNDFPVKVIETNGWLPVNSFEDLKMAEEYLSSK